MCFDDDGNAQKVWSYVGPGQGRFDKVERYMPVAGGSWTIKEVEPRSKIWGCVCCWCVCLLATALAAVLAWLYRDLLFDTLGRADANVESLVHHTPLYDCGRGRWTTSLRAQTDEASKIYRNTMWQDADYNRDGLVSAAELRSGSSKLPECFSQRIYQWDKDGNGLSQAELDFGLQAMFDADAARTFAVADRDCDGYLSLEELGALKASSSLPGYTLDILGGADVDADKKLSQLEFVAAIQKAGLNQPGAGVEVGEIWNETKRQWCCEFQSLGCQNLAPEVQPGLASSNCLHGDVDMWDIQKRQRCCQATGRGCPNQLGTQFNLEHDCQPSLHNPLSAWNMDKRAWGPRAEPKSPCSVMFDSQVSGRSFKMYDCLAGIHNWQQGWSLHKKVWCCDNKKLGCATEQYNCDTAVSSWGSAQRSFCCREHHRGCAKPTIPEETDDNGAAKPLFDCRTGWPKGWKAWSTSKKDFCCSNYARGCKDSDNPEGHIHSDLSPRPLPVSGFDCQAGLANWHSWKSEKKTWCCAQRDIACSHHGSFDCEAGSPKTWKTSKKDYCCLYSNKGCEFDASDSMQPAAESHIYHNFDYSPYGHYGHYGHDIHYGSHVPVSYEPYTHGHGSLVYPAGHWTHSDAGGQSDNFQGNGGRFEGGEIEGTVPGQAVWEPGSAEGAVTNEEGFEPGSEEGAVTGEEGFEPGSEEGAVTGEEGIEPGSEEGAVTTEEGFEPGSEEGAATNEEGFEPGSEEGAVTGEEGFEPGSEEGAVTGEEGFEKELLPTRRALSLVLRKELFSAKGALSLKKVLLAVRKALSLPRLLKVLKELRLVLKQVRQRQPSQRVVPLKELRLVLKQVRQRQPSQRLVPLKVLRLVPTKLKQRQPSRRVVLLKVLRLVPTKVRQRQPSRRVVLPKVLRLVPTKVRQRQPSRRVVLPKVLRLVPTKVRQRQPSQRVVLPKVLRLVPTKVRQRQPSRRVVLPKVLRLVPKKGVEGFEPTKGAEAAEASGSEDAEAAASDGSARTAGNLRVSSAEVPAAKDFRQQLHGRTRTAEVRPDESHRSCGSCGGCGGSSQSATYTYAGEGKGNYRIVSSYEKVGDPKADAQANVRRCSKPRASCVLCFTALLALAVAAVCLVQAKRRSGLLNQRGPEPGSPASYKDDTGIGQGWTEPTADQIDTNGNVYDCASDRGLTVLDSLVDAARRCSDADKDGTVKVAEVLLCQELPPPVADRVAHGDENGDGRLDVTEFHHALRGAQDGKGVAGELYKVADANGNGEVDDEELEAVEQQGLLPESLVAQLWASDADGDGVLSELEFGSVSRPFTQGRGSDLSQAAWGILDGNDDGIVSKDRLKAVAAWAHVDQEALLQFLGSGSHLTKHGFFAAAAALRLDAGSKRQDWCCRHRGVCSFGVSTTLAPLRSIQLPFNCHDGYDDWSHAWDYDKQVWCCQHYARGCPHWTIPPTSDSVPFDCSAGYSNWQSGWSVTKQQWCCRHKHLGCSRYNCDHGRDSWKSDWTSSKKEWCCVHSSVGCAQAPAPASAFDCHAGFSNWRDGWSAPKKAWCCGHYQLACEQDPFDCSLAANWEHEWSDGQKAWCCDHRKVGCAFNCSSSGDWSPRQKAWCCLHEKLGCPEEHEDYDCGIGLEGWRAHWSQGKKTWCCEHYHRGCDYDCGAGWLTWKEGWSAKKKAWCCQHKGHGCPHSDTPRFDCREEAPDAWAQDKKDWCCKQEHLGCAKQELYNCSSGLSNWRHGWSDHKKDWCCRHHSHGCKFDCREGISHWKEQWSASQKRWCCDHIGFGCER
ncbi:unnamed protein product [Effrenium voratum]|nr:unnamed protein product [Effrenium voratum]